MKLALFGRLKKLNTHIMWPFKPKVKPLNKPPPKPYINYFPDDSKSDETIFLEVAKLCARGYCHIDLRARHISGLTLVLNHEAVLTNGRVDIEIPMTYYPGAQGSAVIGLMINYGKPMSPEFDAWFRF